MAKVYADTCAIVLHVYMVSKDLLIIIIFYDHKDEAKAIYNCLLSLNVYSLKCCDLLQKKKKTWQRLVFD